MAQFQSHESSIQTPFLRTEQRKNGAVSIPRGFDSDKIDPIFVTSDILEGEIVPVASISAAAQSIRTSTPQEIDPEMSTPTTEPGDAVEVMRVWRDLSDGSLIIQMGNQRYRTLEEVRNPELARRFTAVVRELWSMVSGAPRITPLPEQHAAAPLPPANQPAAAVPRVGIISPTAQDTAKKGRGKGKNEPEPPSGIVGAVEEFLQFRLSTTSHLSARSIHIRPSHDHGVRIEVDGHFYDSIEDVIDADVREFLQNMMKEWEARL